MAGSGFRIGRLFGINVYIDWSWLFIFFLITWNLRSAFGQLHPEWGVLLAWGTAVLASLLFFSSVLAHEMAHSLVARSQGVPVRRITLFIFGGVSSIQREPESPGKEFAMAILGPLTSLVIGGLLILGVNLFAEPLAGASRSPLGMLRGLGPLSTLLLWLGSVNVILGVFNLIPGFPLDGGRVLRSIVWKATGDLVVATRWASWVGQAIAWLMITAGIAMVFGVRLPLLGGGLVNGLWLAVIGWFLSNAAIQSYRQVVVQDLLGDVQVSEIMRRNPPTVPSTITVDELVHDYLMGTDERAFPVVDGERLEGIVAMEDVRRIERVRWPDVTVREIMTPRENLVVAAPEDDAAEAMSRLAQRDVSQAPVVSGGALVGLLRLRDIVCWLQLQGRGGLAEII